MSSIGTSLKEARNKKSISLEEVHSRIKIHPRVIQLLEEDKFEKLPSPVFVKSFLKSYAEFLEMNPEEIVRAYEKGGKKDPAQVLYIKTAAERERRSFLNFDKTFLVIPTLIFVVAVAAGAFYYLAKTAAHHIKEKKAATAAVSKLSKTRSSKLDKQSGGATKVASADVFDASNWLRHASLGNFPKISKKDALHLKIKAADSVWLRVKSDEKVLFQSILKHGTAETWVANDHFEIWTGNASNMELSVNNYDIGSPGKGVTKKMLINREGVRIAS